MIIFSYEWVSTLAAEYLSAYKLGYKYLQNISPFCGDPSHAPHDWLKPAHPIKFQSA